MADVEVFSFWFSRKAFKQARLCERKIWLLHCLQMRTMSHLSFFLWIMYIYIFIYLFFIMNRMVSHAALKLVQVILTPGFRKVFFHHSLSENFAPKAKPRMTWFMVEIDFFFFFHCYMMWLNVYFVKKKKKLSCFRMLLIVRIGKFSRQVWKKFLDD